MTNASVIAATHPDRRSSFVHVLVASALTVASIIALATSADARSQRSYEDGATVYAQSRHGNGDVSGPVRRGRDDWQVRLPGGTWVSCRTSCEETLRVETVDIFETDGRVTGYGTVQNECGIFGCLDIGVPRRGW